MIVYACIYTLRRNCIHVNVRKTQHVHTFSLRCIITARPHHRLERARCFSSHTVFSREFFFQVVNSQRTGSGGGLATEGESIEVLHLDEKETKEMLDNETIDKPLGLIYAIQWRQMKLAGLL